MFMRTFRPTIPLITACAVACAGGGDGSEETDPLETYACLNVADGDLIDVALTREEAPTITIGRDPYIVNLYPEQAGFLKFDVAAATTLVLQTDFVGAVPGLWVGDERQEVVPFGPNPTCEEDLPEATSLDVGPGPHWLEVGPVFQASVWLMLAEQG